MVVIRDGKIQGRLDKELDQPSFAAAIRQALGASDDNDTVEEENVPELDQRQVSEQSLLSFPYLALLPPFPIVFNGGDAPVSVTPKKFQWWPHAKGATSRFSTRPLRESKQLYIHQLTLSFNDRPSIHRETRTTTTQKPHRPLLTQQYHLQTHIDLITQMLLAQ